MNRTEATSECDHAKRLICIDRIESLPTLKNRNESKHSDNQKWPCERRRSPLAKKTCPHAPIVQIDGASVRLLGRHRVHGRLILESGGDALEAVIVAVQHQRDLRARVKVGVGVAWIEKKMRHDVHVKCIELQHKEIISNMLYW